MAMNGVITLGLLKHSFAVALIAFTMTDVVAAQQPAPGESLGLPSIPNLRDVGGYTTREGVVLRRGLLFRSDQLNPVSEADLQKLGALKLKNDFDLRTADERSARPDQTPPGVSNVWLDVLADADQLGPAQLEPLMRDPKRANAELGGGKVDAIFIEAYRSFVSLPSAKAAYRRLFMSLADDASLPALFHCTTGKDRTGWAAAAFLSLMGASRDVVMQDYLQSNRYILPAYKSQIDSFVAAGGDREIPESLLGVKAAYLDAAFDEMTSKYGTIQDYFSKALDIDTATQKRLTKKFQE